MTNSTKSQNAESENEFSSDSKSQTSSRPKQTKTKKKRGRKSNQTTHKYVSSLVETPAVQIFAVAFNYFLKDRNIFASAAGNKISVYECLETPDDDGQSIKLLRVYLEPDKDEVFNSVSWSIDPRGPILATGGVKAVARVIYCNGQPMKCYRNLVGHTGAINDTKFHPTKPHLLLTCSKDYSIRLWNVRNSVCVAIFAGIRGHRDEVLSIDISADGQKFISGGIDHNIMVWSLNSEEINEKIKKSHEIEAFGRGTFAALRLHFPEFSTRDIHSNYVDSVKFFGDTFLSKSCENNIIWWKIKETSTGLVVSKLFTFEITECDIWFMKMEMDLGMKYLAVGTQNGKINVFDLETEVPMNKRSSLTHIKCNSAIRQSSFSRDGDILIAACDDGSIWRWDKKKSTN